MSSLEIVTAASDPAFYARVSFHALKVAQAVSSEAEDHPNHLNRVQYANRIFQGDDNAILLAQHVATNPTISASLESDGPEGPLDGDIEFTLSSIWDARANAFYAPVVPLNPTDLTAMVAKQVDAVMAERLAKQQDEETRADIREKAKAVKAAKEEGHGH